MRSSLLVSGLKQSGKKTNGTGRRSRLIQSLVVAANATDDEDGGRKDSLERHRAPRDVSRDSETSLPQIKQTPIRIKNRIYTVVEKFAGKSLFQKEELLKPEEIFIGGVEDAVDNQSIIGKVKN